MDLVYLEARIARTKELIVIYEDAIDALGVAGAIQSYTIDTGQSRQTVTRADIPTLDKMLDALYNRLTTFEARLNGAASIGGPAW